MPCSHRLLEFVKQRLAETGWNDAIYAHCSGIKSTNYFYGYELL
jgi:hypothetical protein